jgi:dynein light intermediate chain 1, cytosolic
LRSVLLSLDSPLIRYLEELAGVLRDRGRPGAFDGGGGGVTDGDVKVPLGPGELDEALGIPLCVVCQNVSKNMDASFRLTTPQCGRTCLTFSRRTKSKR